jgi:hypothetical protein
MSTVWYGWPIEIALLSMFAVMAWWLTLQNWSRLKRTAFFVSMAIGFGVIFHVLDIQPR